MKLFQVKLHHMVVFFIMPFTFSCKTEDVKKEPIIDSELVPYVTRFVDEAKQRGKIISLDKLEAKLVSNQYSCGSGSTNPPKVSIGSPCWSSLPDVAKEIWVFHLLGQAILGRTYNDILLQTGDYASMMNRNPLYLYNEYTPAKRTYYLDELFRVVTVVPAWTFIKTNETTIFKDEITTNNSWQYFVGSANHTASLSGDFSSSPYSLSIKSNGISSGTSYWAYSWKANNIEEGSDLVLKVKIKGSALSGGGAYFAFRANVIEKDYPIFFYTTQKDNPIIGTNDFKEYSIKVNYFPNKCDQLSIFLLMDGTSLGTVYFDDIQLLKYN